MARNKYHFHSKCITKTFEYQRNLLASKNINTMTNIQLLDYIRKGAGLIEEQTRRTARQFELKIRETGYFTKKADKPNLSFSDYYTTDIHNEIITILDKDFSTMKQSQLRFYAGRVHQLLTQDYYTREGVSEQDKKFMLYIKEFGEFEITSAEQSKNISRLLQELYKNKQSGYHKIKYETQLKEIFSRLDDEGFLFLLNGDLSDDDIKNISDVLSGREPVEVLRDKISGEEDLDGSIIDLVGNRSKKY